MSAIRSLLFPAGSDEDYRGWMDDLVRIFRPRVRSVLAAEFQRQLATAEGGGDVYAAAVTHSGGLAWRTAVNTRGAHTAAAADAGTAGAADSAATAGAAAEAAAAAADDAHVRRLRWSPAEWTAHRARNSPLTADLLADLEAWISDSTHVEATSWTHVRRILVDLIVESVDSDDVRSVFAAVGASPVLLVCETDETHGDTDSVVAALEHLNADHPRSADVDEALLHWRDEA